MKGGDAGAEAVSPLGLPRKGLRPVVHLFGDVGEQSPRFRNRRLGHQRNPRIAAFPQGDVGG